MKTNLNQTMRAKIKDRESLIRIYTAEMDRMFEWTPSVVEGHVNSFVKKNIKGEYLEMKLYDLMYYFGKAYIMGNNPPIDINLEILEEH